MPNASAAMPNAGGVLSGSHADEVRKLAVLTRSAGIALTTRNSPIPAMIASTRIPAAIDRPLNTRSPRRRARPRIGDDAGDDGWVVVGVVVTGTAPAGAGCARSC